MQKKGFQLASMCSCCESPTIETIDHVFVSSETARNIWRKFEDKLHLNCSSNSLDLKLSEWWLSKVRSPCHKELLSFIPVAICWELWKSRNRARYEGIRSGFVQKVHNVETAIKAIFQKAAVTSKSSRMDILLLHDWGVQRKYKKAVELILVKWKRPRMGWFKLNSDGCSKGNPGESGGGCILRDDKGSMIWALTFYFGVQTNMVADTRALFNGVKNV